ncbi:MAG TPA: hypothetical protein VKD22_11515 [Ramlibacter sp.]|nr:hypothetical protein [Ramlibacter sp.]
MTGKLNRHDQEDAGLQARRRKLHKIVGVRPAHREVVRALPAGTEAPAISVDAVALASGYVLADIKADLQKVMLASSHKRPTRWEKGDLLRVLRMVE